MSAATGVLLTCVWAGLLFKVGVSMTTNYSPIESPLRGGLSDANVPFSSPFTEDEIEELVDLHNLFRNSVYPAAANMEYMDWDPYLQEIAQRWAEECLWKHGEPDDVTGYYGQNLWASSGAAFPKAVMNLWVDERFYYNFTSNQCVDGKKCGHYTQIVWANTNSVGCGRAFCPKLDGAGSNLWMVVCQYSPAGNLIGRGPYLNGPVCSMCSSGVGECYNNLCRPCSEHNEECECRQVCENCGIVDKKTCTCKCRQGYYGPQCEKMCMDLHKFCGSNPGFPNRRFCNYHPMIPRLCPLMCGTCLSPDENSFCHELTTTVATTAKETTTEVDDGSGDLMWENSEAIIRDTDLLQDEQNEAIQMV